VPFRLATLAQNSSGEWELNARPRDYRSRALPTELFLEARALLENLELVKLIDRDRTEPEEGQQERSYVYDPMRDQILAKRINASTFLTT
jgi:hypothetical protein